MFIIMLGEGSEREQLLHTLRRMIAERHNCFRLFSFAYILSVGVNHPPLTMYGVFGVAFNKTWVTTLVKLAKKPEGTKTTNYMNEEAYALHPKEKLVNIASTCLFGEPKYYGPDKTSTKGSTFHTSTDILDTCDEVDDPEFILKLAAYLRTELYLRTTPAVLLAKVANMKSAKGTGLVQKYATAIIQRADELTEVLAAQLNLFKKPIPNSLKKGLAAATHQFNEYDYAKYNRATVPKLRDVFRVAHPIPGSEEESKLFKKILDNTLETPYTWEVEISKRGNKGEVWDELILSRKLGYMATLRNLRNMIQHGATELEAVASFLQNEKAVVNSKQLPHRYLSAYEAITGSETSSFESDVSKVELLRKAVQNALKISVDKNIPKIKGKTVVICDNSGSARGDGGGVSKISIKSVRTMADIGNLMGLMTWYACDDTMFGVFGDRLVMVRPNRALGMLENFKAVNNAGITVGESSENGVFVMLEKMIKEKIFADRIIVCSDLQIGDGKNQEYGLGLYTHWTREFTTKNTVPALVTKYRKEVNPNFMYYSLCFSGYGNDVIVGEKKVLISGWSDHVFKFINTVEQDSKAQVDYIENYNPFPKQQ